MTYTYNAATKRLLNIKKDGAIVETLGGYDGNGNPSTWTPEGQTQRTLKYDALGRLVSITGGFTASYVYDPFGRRIEKTEAGVTTRYQYDGLDVVAEYSASQLEATYVFGPGIDEVLKLKRGTTLAAYHSDGLGSVVSITDSSNGASLKTYRYDAFGKPVAQTGTLPNAYTYTGREQDASGLYYYRARYYLPSAGRFLTPDPIGLAGGINAYAYVGSNPVNYTDPFGLFPGQAHGPAWPDTPLGFLTAPGLPSDLSAASMLADALFLDASLRGMSPIGDLYIRSFAPFEVFGGGFEGDNRTFTTDLSVTSRISARIPVNLSTLEVIGDPSVRSSYSRCVTDACRGFVHTMTGRPIEENMQAEGQPGVSYSQSANALVVNVFGANPLLPSPDIDLQLTMRRTGGLIMLDLIGDAFPNAEVFYVDQGGESRMLHTFSTAGGVSGPYFYLPGEGRRPMGRAIIEAP